MNTRLVFAFALISLSLPTLLAAQETSRLEKTALAEQIIMPGEAVDLDDMIWVKRLVVVFADTPNDPRYIQQMSFLEDRVEELDDRDVIVLTDTDRTKDTALRQKLRPRGFMLVLVGKDGIVYLRKPNPWDVREITRSIDKMPMRKQEVRDRRAGALSN